MTNLQIYKMLTLQEWQEFQDNQIFDGSELDIKDGFIHMSFAEQIDGIRQKFFKEISPVVLLSLDTQKFDASFFKVEANKPNGNQYPHYYGQLNIEMVVEAKIID
jgi:uncharacterized protein (DUF952 family)